VMDNPILSYTYNLFLKDFMVMERESAHEIYSSLEKVWPDASSWYDFTHKRIVRFVEDTLSSRLNNTSIYLNAGSGGSEYNLPGTCYHLDIAENLINKFSIYYVSSIEKMPFEDKLFDCIICVGSVINYCSALESIQELSRVLKTGGFLVLEFERSNTAELWLNKEYGKKATLQNYEYLNHTHSLWLYAEKYIKELLRENGLSVIKQEHFHNLSAVVNRITKNEELAGKFGRFDFLFLPVSHLMSHNMILLCRKVI